MNDDYIVPVYVKMDELLTLMKYPDDSRAPITPAEILTVVVVAAKYLQNHHERAVCLVQRVGYIGKVSVSRFSRLLHALLDNLYHLVSSWVIYSAKVVYSIIDAMPVPICIRVQRKRCRKVQGSAYEGYCAAKKEYSVNPLIQG